MSAGAVAEAKIDDSVFAHLTPSEQDAYKTNLKLVKDACAPIEPLLKDPTVTDIYRNPDGYLWVKRFGKPKDRVMVLPTPRAEEIAKFTASTIGKTVDDRNTIYSGTIPYYGCRIEVIGPPDVLSVSFAIRKKPVSVYTLDQYVEDGRLSVDHYAFLQDAIANRENIIVAGSTGSGKTTFCNALLHKLSEVSPDDRLFSVEDTGELQFSSRDVVPLIVPTDRMAKAVESALRFFPTRIIFGELRRADATAALIEAWGTGHSGGVVTIHSDNAPTALYRIRSKLEEARVYNAGSKINQSVRVVVFIQSVKGRGPVVTDVIRVQPRMDPKNTGRFVTERVGRSVLEIEQGKYKNVPDNIIRYDDAQRLLLENLETGVLTEGGPEVGYIPKAKFWDIFDLGADPGDRASRTSTVPGGEISQNAVSEEMPKVSELLSIFGNTPAGRKKAKKLAETLLAAANSP